MKHYSMHRQLVCAIFVVVAFSMIGLNSQALAQPAPQQQDPQPPILKIPTALVTVPVIVTDRFGRFITGLNRGDFNILEDGTIQKVDEFSSTEKPFNVAILIDSSHSTQNKLGHIRKAALAFVKQLQPNDRVMIVTFDDQVRFISDFTNNRAELDRAINSLKSNYATSLYDAIHRTIMEKMLRIDGRKAIVVLTDGVDTASKVASFSSTLDLVAATGIISYAIQYETRNDGGPVMKPLLLPSRPGNSFVSNLTGASTTQDKQQEKETKPESTKPIINIPRPTSSIFSEGIPPASTKPAPSPGSVPSTRINSQMQQPIRDRYLVAADFMRSLAAQSGARYIRAENIENTSFAFQLIAEELRHQYTLTYLSSNDQKDGNYRSIAVGVKNSDLVVRARMGYRVPKEEPEAEKKPANPEKP
ncbi:MAG: VWA domain-containing protein [Blastocatellia bacterium]